MAFRPLGARLPPSAYRSGLAGLLRRWAAPAALLAVSVAACAGPPSAPGPAGDPKAITTPAVQDGTTAPSPAPAPVATAAVPAATPGAATPPDAATAVPVSPAPARPAVAAPTSNLDRFGVVEPEPQQAAASMAALGLRWYLDYSYSTANIPPGVQKALKVQTRKRSPAADLAAAARGRPGSAWLIGNEPNVPGQDDVSPEAYADTFNYYVTTIRAADPTAVIVGPEMLNFSFTCEGCGGFTAGAAWVEGFRKAYLSNYGGEPPIDVWSIHTYDLKWSQLPQGDYTLQTEQIAQFRAYVDSLPAHRGKPIWLTEFAVVWGYDDVNFDQTGKEPVVRPAGAFRTDHLLSYIQSMADWLSSRSTSLNIQRWFIFATHAPKEPWASAPSGIGLLTEDNRLTEFGTLYRTLANRN